MSYSKFEQKEDISDGEFAHKQLKRFLNIRRKFFTSTSKFMNELNKPSTFSLVNFIKNYNAYLDPEKMYFSSLVWISL